jgi:predicted RNA binding protein YcfA (HicA-like mRNA interferase family)
MKRVKLLRRLGEEGCVLVRSRGGHDIYRNVITGATQPVPRHRDINEITARSILRHLSTPEPEA